MYTLSTMVVLSLEKVKYMHLELGTTGAALCNAHGQCDQIFAKVGDGRLQQ